VLALTAALAPIVVPFLLALLVLVAVMLWRRLRATRSPAPSRS
jgi:sensor domain CHASE-containing protein